MKTLMACSLLATMLANNADLPIVHYSLPTNEMELALTFDDGPLNKNTSKVLDILKENNVKATFFLLGENMVGNEAIMQRILDEGHEIGLHTYSHPIFTKINYEQTEKEIDLNIDLLYKICHYRAKIIRPPYGIISKNFLKIAKAKKLKIISWSNDSLDWKKGHTTKMIYEDALAKTHPGSIILMHDKSNNYQQSIKALPLIIRKLKSEGYSFKRVSDFNIQN